MTKIERMHEERINALDRRVDVLSVKVDALSSKIDNFITESRRTADRQDARMQQLEQRWDNTLKHIQNLTIVSIVGIVTIAIATIAFVVTR